MWIRNPSLKNVLANLVLCVYGLTSANAFAGPESFSAEAIKTIANGINRQFHTDLEIGTVHGSADGGISAIAITDRSQNGKLISYVRLSYSQGIVSKIIGPSGEVVDLTEETKEIKDFLSQHKSYLSQLALSVTGKGKAELMRNLNTLKTTILSIEKKLCNVYMLGSFSLPSETAKELPIRALAGESSASAGGIAMVICTLLAMILFALDVPMGAVIFIMAGLVAVVGSALSPDKCE